MAKVIDLTGKMFGRLTVIRYHSTIKNKRYWLCECVCGNIATVQVACLTSAGTNSCGCYRKEIIRTDRNSTHGRSTSRVYYKWQGMRGRCNNPKNRKYSSYGGRGIRVCPEWESFETFLNDMGEPPSERHSLDRIDNDKGYSKDNCRWATDKEQANNRRSTWSICIQGKNMNMREYAQYLSVSKGYIYRRLSKGFTIEEIENLSKKGNIGNDIE